MVDTPNNSGRWQMPKPSITSLLAITLLLNLIFSGYLLFRLNERTQDSSLTSPISTPSSEIIVQPGQVKAQAPYSSGSTSLTSPDIDIMMAQLQDTQSKLQILSGQLEQKSQAAGFSSPGSAAQNPAADEELYALWAEIEQLYQVMQPLMVQVEVASATQSSRSPSELIALRTQVNTIHQRLAVLLSRVEAAKNRSNVPYSYGTWSGTAQWGTSKGSSTNATSPDEAMLKQLYQNMTEMNNMLQQLQSQGTSP